MLKAIIIDDEVHCTKTMEVLLSMYCPEVYVTAVCHNGIEGIEMIRKTNPDLVFLDVEMPKMNGFELLEQLGTINFKLIFTTSYDQYALKAFRYSAIDYLLKPVDKGELQFAINKVKQNSPVIMQQQVEALIHNIGKPGTRINKIALPTMEGLQMIPIDSIISCESNDNYTILQLKDKRKILISCTLKEVEESLHDFSFARVHRSYLVNLNEVEKYLKGDGGYLVMSDGSSIDVSRSKKESLLKTLLPKKD